MLLYEQQASVLSVDLDVNATLGCQLPYILEKLQYAVEESVCCEQVDNLHCARLSKYQDAFYADRLLSPTDRVAAMFDGSTASSVHLLLCFNCEIDSIHILSSPPKKLHVFYHPRLQEVAAEAEFYVEAKTSISEICRLACRAVKALRNNVSISTASGQMLCCFGKIVELNLQDLTWANIGGTKIIISDAFANSIPKEHIILDDSLVPNETYLSIVKRGKFHTLDVAVKILRGSAAKTTRSLQSELAVLSQLRHPKILTLIGIVENICDLAGSVAIVSEYMCRGSLYDALHTDAQKNWRESLTVKCKLRILLDVADGMRFLHSNKVIHRDLKSPNVLLNGDGRAKICDFGSSAVMQDSQTCATGVMGTMAWTAPEALDEHGVRLTSDVYSFGVIVWEVFTGAIPWNGVSIKEICQQKSRGEHLPLEPLCSVYPDLFPLVEACFNTIPDCRPVFSLIFTDLKQFLLGESRRFGMPVEYLCPISMQVMRDPVICCDGHVFDRRSIETWLESSNLNPCTGLPLRNQVLTSVYSLKTSIEAYCKSLSKQAGADIFL